MAVLSQIVGAVTPTTARVTVQVTGTQTRLAVANNVNISAPTVYGPFATNTRGVYTFEVSHLQPNQRYWFVTHDNHGQVYDHAQKGTFLTHPPIGEPAAFSFAASACALGTDHPGTGDLMGTSVRVSNHPAFDAIRQTDALFFMHNGDMHYYDLGSDRHGVTGGASLTNYRRAYEDVFKQPRQNHLYRTMPLQLVWDDHDYGPNDSDGTHTGKDNAAQAFRERIPHYTLVESSGAIYHSFQVGRVLFIVSDVRYYRTPNAAADNSNKTQLGRAQKDWMYNLLSSTSAAFLVWQMPGQWLGIASDTWISFQAERDELVNMLDELGWLHRMCMVSGDKHDLAIDTGGGNPYGGFPIFHFASIDSMTGEVYDHWDTGPSQPGRGQYGVMEIIDDGQQVTVTGTGYDPTGFWRSHSFEISTVDDDDEIIEPPPDGDVSWFTTADWHPPHDPAEPLPLMQPDGCRGILILEGVEGLGAAPRETNRQALSTGGATARWAHAEERLITLPLMLRDESRSGLLELQRDVTRAFTATTPAAGQPRAGRLRINRPNGLWREIEAIYLDGLNWSEDTTTVGQHAAFPVLQLVCPDPWWYGPSRIGTEWSFVAPRNYLAPYQTVSPSQVFGQQTVIIDSDVDVSPVWTVTGPATEATAGIMEGPGWRLGALEAGEVITIDAYRRTVTDQDGGNRFGDLIWPTSSLFMIPPGPVRMYVNIHGGEAGPPPSSIRLDYRPRFETA